MIVVLKDFDFGVLFLLSLILLEIYSLVKANHPDRSAQSQQDDFYNFSPYSIKLYLIAAIILLLGCLIKSFFIIIICALVLLTEIFLILVNNIGLRHKNKRRLPFVFGTKFSTSRIVVYTQLCFFLAICLLCSYGLGTSNGELIGMMLNASKIFGKGLLSTLKKIDPVRVAENTTAGVLTGTILGAFVLIVKETPDVVSNISQTLSPLAHSFYVDSLTPLGNKLSHIGHREAGYLAEDMNDWFTAKLDSFPRVYYRHLPLNISLHWNFRPESHGNIWSKTYVKIETINFPKPVPTIREENWNMVSELVNDLLDEIIDDL